jgi:predicted RNase H-like nuclease
VKPIYIGIDLAWSDTNASALAIIEQENGLEIIDVVMLDSNTQMVDVIQPYLDDQSKIVTIGVDAPLLVNNKEGNRAIEKAFIKDFSPYKRLRD